jgi:hypothetical protein
VFSWLTPFIKFINIPVSNIYETVRQLLEGYGVASKMSRLGASAIEGLSLMPKWLHSWEEAVMRQVPLREFRTRGAKALGQDEGQGVVILSNRQGPAYFLVPVQPGDLESQGRELCKAQAKASLRAWQLRARELGLDQMSDQEIDAEIKAARAERHLTRKPAQ